MNINRSVCALPILFAFFVMGGVRSVQAQPAPESALLVQAQAAVANKNIPKAIESLKQLTEKFPNSASAADATVMWFQIAQDTGDTVQAAALWTSAFAKWPKSETIWEMIVINCATKVKQDPAKALADLERYLADPTFPPEDASKGQALRFSYLQKVNPEGFLKEGVDLVQQVDRCTSPEALDLYHGVACRIYLPLMKANRMEEAKAIRKKMQQKTALMGNPNNWLGEDTVAYFDALAQVNVPEYMIQVKPLILAAQWADNAVDAALPADLAKRAYTIYFTQGKLDEVQQMHTILQQSLKAANLPEVAFDDNVAYASKRLDVLYAKDPKQWLVEAIPFVDTVKEAKYIWDMDNQASTARKAFMPLVQAGRIAEARTLRDKVCTEMIRLKADPGLMWTWYLIALSTQPADVFLAEGLPVVDTAKTTKNPAELGAAVQVLKFIYPALIGSGKLESARSYHTALQASIVRLGSPAGLATQEQQEYLNALVKAKPELVLAELKPLLDTTTAPATPTEALERSMLARGAYGPLMIAGRIDDASALHVRVQDWLTTAKNPDEAKADTDAFRQSVSKEAVEAMYTLFKQSLAANDADGARKWLANLNMVAPEHPRSSQARKMFKTFEDQQPK